MSPRASADGSWASGGTVARTSPDLEALDADVDGDLDLDADVDPSLPPDPDVDEALVAGHLGDDPVSPRALGLLLSIGGAVGFLAAFVLTVERFRLAEDPSYRPSCSINPYISCGSVMASHQASLFGFPNPLLGVGAFAVATTLGLLLVSGVQPPRWMRLGLQGGITLGLVFVIWLITQALGPIHALCPYCIIVWVLVIPMFVVTTADTLDRQILPIPRALHRAAALVIDYRVPLIVGSYAVVVLAVGVAFWGYWKTLL